MRLLEYDWVSYLFEDFLLRALLVEDATELKEVIFFYIVDYSLSEVLWHYDFKHAL